MKNSTKTFSITGLASAFTIALVIYLQIGAERSLSKCSYLDPITVDILAFAGGLFLIIEGIYNIVLNKDNQWPTQATRVARVALGFAIITIHIIQFLHK